MLADELNCCHMHRWIEAYRSGLPTKEAQLQVQQFSSTKYKSHRHIPETVARLFDRLCHLTAIYRQFDSNMENYLAQI